MARFAPVLALAALIAAGCGGGDDEDDAPTRAASVPANGSVEVSADEYSFDPGRITVGGAGGIELSLRNDGSLAHDLRLLEEDRDVGGTKTISGGEQTKAVLDLQPGRYQLICSVGDHAELGMRGELRVK